MSRTCWSVWMQPFVLLWGIMAASFSAFHPTWRLYKKANIDSADVFLFGMGTVWAFSASPFWATRQRGLADSQHVAANNELCSSEASGGSGNKYWMWFRSVHSKDSSTLKTLGYWSNEVIQRKNCKSWMSFSTWPLLLSWNLRWKHQRTTKRGNKCFIFVSRKHQMAREGNKIQKIWIGVKEQGSMGLLPTQPYELLHQWEWRHNREF